MKIPYFGSTDEEIDSQATEEGMGMMLLAELQEKLKEFNANISEKGEPLQLEVVFNSTDLQKGDENGNLKNYVNHNPGVNVEGVSFSPAKEKAVETLIHHIIEKGLV